MSIFSPRSSRHDHAHARAARADAGADRVDAVGVGDDGDLRAVAGLAGDAGDLDQAVGDLGHLELEELLDQLGVAARDDDARPLGLVGDLLDDRLDPLGVVVALVLDLLGLGQQRLDALAQLDERVARVGLLDDAGDQLADAVAVLLEHHVALGLADALQDHLLGRLRGDAAEVVRGDVACSISGRYSWSFSGSSSGSGGSRRSPVSGSTCGSSASGQTSSSSSSSGGQVQLPDGEVAGLAVHLDARVLGGVGGLLVGGQQRVLQRDEELLGRDALLPGEGACGFKDLFGHGLLPHEVGTLDVVVGDGHHAAVGGEGDRRVGRPDELAGEAAAAVVAAVASAHAGAAAEEATEVVGLGERALGAG